MPKTSFKPIRRVTLYTINHEDQNLLNNRKISKYIYKGTEQAVSTWKAMFENVLNSLHSEHPALLPVLAETTDNSNVLSRFVFTEPGKNFAEVGDSLYVFQPTQTDVMLYLLSRFFEAYGEDPDDLVIVLNDTKTPKEIAEAELKIEKHASTKFFKYARHIIENIQGTNCLFTTYRVKRWTLFWDNFCLPPYSLSCIVISNGAAVVLEFNSSDEENEMLFNQLYGHKEEIERKLGAAIFSEESRRSVSVQLDKGLSDEENWQEIAQFLATWSMEFYKVLIPYLE